MFEEKQRLVNFNEMPQCGGVWGVPKICGDSVYFGAADTHFYCIDAEKGRKNWTYKTNGIILSTPAIKDGVIYFGCFDQNLYAIDSEGTFLWKFRTGGLIASSPAIYENVIYFGSSDYSLYAVDMETRQELWRFRTGDEIIGDPLIHNNRIYFGSMDSYFYCLDLNGNLMWKFKTGDSILLGAPTISDGLIYFSSGDHVLYALKPDGMVAWKFYSGGIMYNWPFVYGDTILVGNRERYVYALDKKTGICKWKFTSGTWAPRPVVYCGEVYITAEHIFCLTMDGYKKWEYGTGITNAEGIEVTERGCFFGCGLDAKVSRLSHDGRLIWEFKTNGAISAAPLFKAVIPGPKWNPDLLADAGTPTAIFSPYTLLNKGGVLEKFMEDGIDTSERYAGIRESASTYKLMAESGSVGAYRAGGTKKKKTDQEILDDLLENQRRNKFGI